VIIIEHRFYGLSNPIDNLKSESLQYHTIQQAIDDLEYFTKNVVLPQPNGDKLAPGQAPWVLFGGSYSGKLSAIVATPINYEMGGITRCLDKLDNGEVSVASIA
jgi:hypothetical protein